MALSIKDRIYQETETEGTGKLTLTRVKEGYQGFVALPNGAQTYYCITNDNAWEVGEGQYVMDGTDTLTRTLLSSSTGALLNLTGVSSVFCTYPAEKGVLLNFDGNIYLPNSNSRFKTITADNEVVSPTIVTEAVIVDGTAGSDGDLAKLLNVYTKPEVDEIHRVHDVKVEQNSKDIVELEEEIEALAPSFDRGHWNFEEPVTLPAEPSTETYYLLNEEGEVELDYANTHKVVFSNTDVGSDVHTWSDVEVGQYLELFDEKDSDFLLAQVDVIELKPNYASFEVSVIKSEGSPRGIEGVDDSARVKFFSINDEVDLSAYMPITGGKFTGEVTHKKDIFIEPTMPRRFITIKNRYATNPDGSSAGTGDTEFGVDFDLDHGNTGYNTVKFTNRDGDILAVKGGTKPAVKYSGEITDDIHIVNKKYVDDAIETAINEYIMKNQSTRGIN